MQTGQQRYSNYGYQDQSRGPEILYGYCHDTKRMRMMDYADYMKNIQTGYTNLYSDPASSMQPMMNVMDTLSTMMRGMGSSGTRSRRKHDCDCERWEKDCACSCCIRCADVVEYARCGEVRRIPVTFDNDTRREREINLQLGSFATESGQDVVWTASLSETAFKLPPCGEKTILVSVNVDCEGMNRSPNQDRQADRKDGPIAIDNCKVVYATLRADGCTIRPLVLAVAVLPDHCGAHGIGCGCCN